MQHMRAWLMAVFLLVFGLVGALHVHDPIAGNDGDNCAICHVLSQGASGVAPELAIIVLVWTGALFVFTPIERPALISTIHSPYRSRGPPRR